MQWYGYYLCSNDECGTEYQRDVCRDADTFRYHLLYIQLSNRCSIRLYRW